MTPDLIYTHNLKRNFVQVGPNSLRQIVLIDRRYFVDCTITAILMHLNISCESDRFFNKAVAKSAN